MTNPRSTVLQLKASITGNVVAQVFLQAKNGKQWGGDGIEAGGRVVLGTATTADVLVTDTQGKVLKATTTFAANGTIDPIPAGVKGPLLVTITNISNAAHTLTVFWNVKR